MNFVAAINSALNALPLDQKLSVAIVVFSFSCLLATILHAKLQSL